MKAKALQRLLVAGTAALGVIALLCTIDGATVFALTTTSTASRSSRRTAATTTTTTTATSCLHAAPDATINNNINNINDKDNAQAIMMEGRRRVAVTTAALALSAALLFVTTPLAWADEYGVETEAPTLFTGETVMICKKRGPLGACLETVPRTAENDNDKASKYFREPIVQRKDSEQQQDANNHGGKTTANALIEKLKQQSEDNREANELAVRTKTMLNDQSASFGPFDRSVVVLNTDGRTFTLLENPQAMRLKKAGFIEDRRFVKQPTEQEMEDALGKQDGDGGILGGLVKGIFGGGGGGAVVVDE